MWSAIPSATRRCFRASWPVCFVVRAGFSPEMMTYAMVYSSPPRPLLPSLRRGVAGEIPLGFCLVGTEAHLDAVSCAAVVFAAVPLHEADINQRLEVGEVRDLGGVG